MAPCVVADLGGTFLRCALVSSDKSLYEIERHRLAGDTLSRNVTIWNDVIEAIATYVRRHSYALSSDAPIAFAFPGPILGSRLAAAAPTVHGGSSKPPDIQALLAARTGRDVYLVNDVSAAAWYFGERVPASRFLVVTVSSGIAAKIFDRNHRLGVIDDVPSAGEIGHLVVDECDSAPLCDCGGRGHLGAIASARGFERNTRMAAVQDSAGFSGSANVSRFGATPATLTNELHLVPALRAGDRWTTTLLRRSVRPLANVLRTLCVGSGIDQIVVIGGFAQALGETYRALLEDSVGMLSDCGPARAAAGTSVVIAGTGEEPSLLGAARYVGAAALVS